MQLGDPIRLFGDPIRLLGDPIRLLGDHPLLVLHHRLQLADTREQLFGQRPDDPELGTPKPSQGLRPQHWLRHATNINQLNSYLYLARRLLCA